MKSQTKLIRTLVAVICSCFWLSTAQAQPYGENILILHDATALPSSSVTIYVEIVNETAFPGFMFDIPLPEGITYSGPANWYSYLRQCDNMGFASLLPGTSILRAGAYTLVNCPFGGNNGVAMLFNLDTPSQIGNFELMVENLIIGNTQGINVATGAINGTIMVTPGGQVSGDANCDGVVNVADIITALDYVLGGIPKPFCFGNAELNGNTLVNVEDVVGIVNIILGY